MALNEGPFGTYPNVTGVVNATAKTEITALMTQLKNLILTDTATSGQPAGNPERIPPDFDPVRREYAALIHGEIAGVEAAIQAAPTS